MGPDPGRSVSGSMRKLHLVGYSADHGGFVLAAKAGARSGSFLLPLSDELVRELDQARDGATQRGAGRRDTGRQEKSGATRRPGASSALTPREIQARLRSGRTMEEVATEAGVGVDWVERFAAPVLAEQAAAVHRAGLAVLHTPRKGPSDRPLEASVLRNLADRSVHMTKEEFEGAWSGCHLVDTDWLISFRYRSRGRPLTAEWILNVANGALTARNRVGAELGFVDPGLPADGADESADRVDEPAAAPTTRRRTPAVIKAPAERPAAAARTLASPTASPRTPGGPAAAVRTPAGPAAGRAASRKATPAAASVSAEKPAAQKVRPQPPAEPGAAVVAVVAVEPQPVRSHPGEGGAHVRSEGAAPRVRSAPIGASRLGSERAVASAPETPPRSVPVPRSVPAPDPVPLAGPAPGAPDPVPLAGPAPVAPDPAPVAGPAPVAPDPAPVARPTPGADPRDGGPSARPGAEPRPGADPQPGVAPAPAGAHFARKRARTPRAQPADWQAADTLTNLPVIAAETAAAAAAGRAEPQPEPPVQAEHAPGHGSSVERPRLPLGDFDDMPESGGPRFPHPD